MLLKLLNQEVERKLVMSGDEILFDMNSIGRPLSIFSQFFKLKKAKNWCYGRKACNTLKQATKKHLFGMP